MSITKPAAPKQQHKGWDNTPVPPAAVRKNYAAKGVKLHKRWPVCLEMDQSDEVYAAPPAPHSPLNQAVPALLTAAVIGLGGLFMQVAKLDQSVNTVASDIQELKNDSKERLSDLESRVRQIEMTVGRKP